MTSPKWMQYAEKEIGQTEIPGDLHNSRIVEYHRETSLGASDDETPWCASYVNWVLKQAGIAGTNSAAARSFQRWGRGIDKPEYGCIVVLRRGTQEWQGHVGFYVDEDAEHVWLLGGNQNNQVNVSKYPKKDILAYRMPKRAIDSKTVVTTTTGAAATIAGLATELLDSVNSITNAITEDPLKPALIVMVALLAGFIIYERVKKIMEYQI